MLPEIVTPVPGPRSRAAAGKLRRYESRNVTYIDDDFPIFWERAEGVNVWDVDGNRFLDWTSAFGVTGLGHTAPVVQAAMREQAGLLLHAMGDVHPTPLKAELCELLSQATFERWGAGRGKTILGNSGFEAVEAALKTAFLATGRRTVVAFEGSYHGLGFGALEVTGNPFFREPFRGQLADFARFFPFPRNEEALEPLERKLTEALETGTVGAILVEPIQGRGGEIIPPRAFLPLLRRLADRYGALLILDEIYTGWNRTGALFACEHSGVVPDVICLGKALASGYPLSACVGREGVMDAWPPSHGEALHTSTFLGNPVGCRMALASIREHLKPGVAETVARKGEQLLEALRRLESPAIREVRGIGLLAAVEFTLNGAETNALVKQGLQEGLILLQSGPEGNILGFSPPFAIVEEEMAYTVERLQPYLKPLPGSDS